MRFTLGRIATETVGATTTTISYVGTSKTASRLAVGATNIDALLGADGSRLATLSGSSFGWLTPDLHGDVAGASSASFGSITDALRYDAFGTIAASTTSALPTPWRYQGQLLVDPAGASDLYVDGARYYAPGLGAFTQLDSTQGAALNPLSMNRYLYAEANPETFTDPSGHVTIDEGDAYNSTLTNDATHHHTVTRHLSGKQMYPGFNWKSAEATFLKERRAQLAGDAAHARQVRHTGEAGIEAQDAASAGVSVADWGSQAAGDLGSAGSIPSPSELPAKCNRTRFGCSPSSVSIDPFAVLGAVSDVTGVAATVLSIAGAAEIGTGVLALPGVTTEGLAGALEGVSLVTGAASTLGECSHKVDAACGLSATSTLIGAVGPSIGFAQRFGLLKHLVGDSKIAVDLFTDALALPFTIAGDILHGLGQ